PRAELLEECVRRGIAETVMRVKPDERAASERSVPMSAERRGELGAGREVPSDLEHLGHWLDRVIRLPGNVRIGLDGLIGLIPGIGDAAGAIMGFYIVSRASSLGLPKAVLARMLLNVGVDTIVGAVPLLGDLFDFAFKANTRNIELMRRALADTQHEKRTSALVLEIGRASCRERGT